MSHSVKGLLISYILFVTVYFYNEVFLTIYILRVHLSPQQNHSAKCIALIYLKKTHRM